MTDVIEFYTSPKGSCIACVVSTMVPTLGSFISIRKTTYKVVGVTYALDHSDDPSPTVMRACVDLKGSKP